MEEDSQNKINNQLSPAPSRDMGEWMCSSTIENI
jgi:hypothetical protein